MLSITRASSGLIAIAVMACGSVFAQDITEPTRLNRYIQGVELEPLYAWPGVDLEAMTRTIDALEASRDELVKISQERYSPEQVHDIQSALYPTAYLKEMRQLEHQRRRLSVLSSVAEVERYQQQLLQTIDKHQGYLKELLPVLERTAATQGYAGLEYHSGRTSFAHFLNVLEYYQSEAALAHAKARNRWQCFLGARDECEIFHYPQFNSTKSPEFDALAFESSPARITNAVRSDDALLGNVGDVPWAILENSSCFPPNQQVPYFMWRYPAGNSVSAFRAEVVSDLMVHDHRLKEGATAYEQKLDEFGARGFLFQTQTTLYACPDAALDAARLQTLDFINETLRKLSEPRVPEDAREDLRVLVEETQSARLQLEAQTYLSEASVERVLAPVIQILQSVGNEDAAQIFGEAELVLLKELILTYELKTAQLEQGIMNLIFSNAAVGDYTDFAPWGYLDELLFTRNGPQLLLGATNPSVVVRPLPLIEELRHGPSPRLLSYTNLLQAHIPPDEMIDILIQGAVAEDRLSRLRSRPYLYGDLGRDQ